MPTTARMSEEARLPGPYEGVHIFAFLYEGDETPPAAVIEHLGHYIDRERGPVYFAAVFDGDFQGFAHIVQDDTREGGNLVDGLLWDAGIRSDYVVEGQWHVNPQGHAMGPTRNSPRFLAMARVSVSQRPSEVMGSIAAYFGDELDEQGQSRSPFIGASTMIGGGFHLLVELGDDDREALNRYVESLSGVDGVGRVEVAVVDTGSTQAA
jgi:hypothetical protein